MSDIFQEVEEDLRRERMKNLWSRYGFVVIGAAVLVVVIVAGYRGYEAWQTGNEREIGTELAEAIRSAETTQTEASAEALQALAADAPGGIAMLAQFRAATTFAESGSPNAAIDLLRTIVRNDAVDPLYRDLARIRLAHVLLDTGAFRVGQSTVASLAEDTSNAFSASAQEVMGLAAYGAGDIAAARRWFTTVEQGATTPPGLRARARFMLSLITQTSRSSAPSRPSETAATSRPSETAATSRPTESAAPTAPAEGETN
ncbi:MAG: tetratricopeptide repeat protein [Pseudomonadota bacterium]